MPRKAVNRVKETRVFKTIFYPKGAHLAARSADGRRGALLVAGLTVLSSAASRAQAPLKPDVDIDEFMKTGRAAG